MLGKYDTGLIGEKELAAKFMKLADIGERKELIAFTKGQANELKGDVKREIQTKLRRHTGNLLKAVRAQKNKYAVRGFASYVVRMDAGRWGTAPHAYLVEFGHGGPKPALAHPYFRPVIYRRADGINTKIKNRARDLLAKISAER